MVYKGTYTTDTAVEVAVKVIPDDLPGIEYDNVKRVKREVALMQRAQHSSIVKYLALVCSLIGHCDWM